MAKKKITYIVSEISDRSIPFEWIAESPLARDFDLSFVAMTALAGSDFENNIRKTSAPVSYVRYGSKKHLPAAILALTRTFQANRPDVIHTHLTGANLAGLAAGLIAGVPKRIYTRHHATLNHDYYRHAVAYDYSANFMATDIIATCQNGREVLQYREKVKPSKIHVLNIGFRLELFGNIPVERVEVLRAKYNLRVKGPVIGVISKYIEWKGIQYIIPAFREILKSYPDAVLVLANARPSPYHPHIQDLLKGIPAGNYREIVFEEDAPALYPLFDVFVHTPVDPQVEAFGQVYIEALASRLPCVFTSSGIAREFIKHENNAWVVDFRNSDQIAQGVLLLLGDREHAREIAKQGEIDVRTRFGFEGMIQKLHELYDS